jgi:hypothetical protein
VGGLGIDGDGFMVGAPKNIDAHQHQVSANPGFKFGTVEIRKEISARDSSDDSGDGELETEGFIDVFMEDMADAADACGEDFRNFDAVADHCRGNA